MARIAEKTVTEVMKKLGADPARLVAALGPSACGECYEVGADVVQAYKSQLSGSDTFFKYLDSATGKAMLNVPAANLQQLLKAGIPRSQIFSSSHCTIHQNDLFFSYRAESKGGGVMVGRQLALIGRR